MPPLRALLLLLIMLSTPTPRASFSLCMPNHSTLCFDLKRGASYHALHVCQARAMRSNQRKCEAAPHVSVHRTHCHSNHIHDSSALRNKQWSDILVQGCQNRRPDLYFILPFSLSFFLLCSSAANGYPDVSQSSEVICPFFIFRNVTFCKVQVHQKDTPNSFHLLLIGGPLSLLEKQCSESHSKWL